MILSRNPSITAWHCPESTAHIRIVLSLLADARRVPHGENDAQFTEAVWAVKT
jgi:hypothetical protein